MNFDELPVGFGMALTMNPQAWNAYSALGLQQKRALVQKAREVSSKEEMYQIVHELGRQAPD